VLLDEGPNEVYAVLADKVGNKSPVPDAAGVEYFSVVVDTAIPQAGFIYPAKGQLNLADKAIDGSDVTISCNIDNSTVYLRDFGALVDTQAVVAGVATFPGALEKCVSGLDVNACQAGNHQYTATVVAAGSANQNFVESVPKQIGVDFEAPLSDIQTPVNGQIFGDAVGALVDSDPDIPGFQVAVTFSTDLSAQSWEIFLSDCGDDATYTNCETEVLATDGTVQVGGGLTEPAEDVTIPISTALSYKNLVLRTTGGVGNTHDDVVPLVFDIQSCVVAFTNLPETTYFNATFCAGEATSCATADLSLDAKFFGPCGGVDEMELIVDGAESATQTAFDFASQTASFLVTVADGTTAQLELKALNDGAGDTG
ncbi:MAG: hypothetical protein VX938_01885, partial [Myxococcota bacterium]|nr:hypothetical protein [Myxococcota bacterium]